MIDRVQELISDRPTEEIWKRIRYFTDHNFVSELITTRHNLPKGKFKSDILKQAVQIAYSLVQAEEYFTSSNNVSLPTRPVLLYYGIVSLSKALILLASSGDNSYDMLRKKKKHQHHGLELCRDVLSTDKSSYSIENFLKSITCRIYCKRDGTPWGHFPLFYESLLPPVIQYQKDIHFDNSSTSSLQMPMVLNGPPSPPIGQLCSKKISLFDLVRVLPDLYFTLRENGIMPGIARGSVLQREDRIHADENGIKTLSKVTQSWNFFIDGIEPFDKESLLAFLISKNPNIKMITDYGYNLHLQLIIEGSPKEPYPNIYYPDIVEDIQSRLYYVIKPEEFVDESSSYLIILFCLGMIARYYPDIWMKKIQENIMLAEFLESLLNIAYRKVPNIVLNQMAQIKYNIHP